MKNDKIKLLTLLFLAGISLAGLQAQQAAPAAGNDATGGGGAASYTIGQPVYTGITSPNGSVNQGVQQAYCDDNNPCTTDDFDLIVGCVFTPLNCNDNNACTTDACNSGTCSHSPICCDDGDVSTVDRCENGVCLFDAFTASCSGNVSCTGSSNGSASVSVSGGTPPYSYSWSNGATTSSISGLPAGGYSVTVTNTSANNAWVQKADFVGTGRTHAVGFNIGNKGYIGTGIDASGYINDFWEYDPCTNAWTQKADFGGGGRSAAVGFSIGSKGYIGTGSNGGLTGLVDFWEYDPSDNTWVRKTDFPHDNPIAGDGRYSAVGFSIGNKGYVGMGNRECYDFVNCDYYYINGEMMAHDWYEFDPSTDTWTQKTAPPLVAFASVGFSIGNRGYVGTGVDFGGSYAYTEHSEFYEYDPDNDVWTQKADFGGGLREDAVGFSIGSKGYIGTGYSGGVKGDFWEFNPYTNTWEEKAPVGGAPREGAVGFSIGAKGYIGLGSGGFYNHAVIQDFWEYTPSDAVVATATCSYTVTETTTMQLSFLQPDYVFVNVLNGSAPFTFMWSNGSNSTHPWDSDTLGHVENLCAGYYSVTVTDNYGCTASGSVFVNGNITCNDGDPCTVDYCDNGTCMYIPMSCDDNDLCTVDGCVNGVCVFDAFTVSCSGNVSCTGSSNGSASVSVSGGTPPYSYSWSNGATTSSISGLPAGDYSVTVANTSAQNAWIQKADFGGAARTYATGFSIGNKGYIGLGSDFSSNPFYKDFWEFDPSTDTWTQKADFGGTARWSAVGFSIGTKGYVGTGHDGVLRNDFWEYDPSTNTWTQKADFGGVPRYRATGFSIGTKGYLGIGDANGPGLTDFWEFDPSDGTQGTWTQKADFGGAGATNATGFSIGTKGYIGLGIGGGTYFHNDFWEFDPDANTWTQKADFAGSGRYAATGFSIGTKGYIGTGYDLGEKNDFWEFDPAANSWTQKANFAQAVSGDTVREIAVGFSIGNKGYIGTGSGNGVVHKDFWEYTPSDAIVCTATCSYTVTETATITTDLLFSSGQNLALNKPATQSSTVFSADAGRAVDGNTDGAFWNGSVTHTNGENQDWWQVDLGSIYTIQSVELWNRTDCCGDRLSNFNVILLDDNQAVVSVVNFPGQAGVQTTILISGIARYVKVQLTGTNYLSLAEVKVWGLSSLCAGSSINIPFTACGIDNPDNIFSAQLSDANGSFVSPVTIGSITSATSGTINAVIPSNTTAGTGYRIRVVSSIPAVTGGDNGSDIIISNCDDNDPCTSDDCNNGTCIHTPLNCDDNDVCTADNCDPINGCFNNVIDCDDFNPCTWDICDFMTGCFYSSGDCDDSSPCTVDNCDPLNGCVNTPINCDDGDPCTVDLCDNGICIYYLLNCDDFDACTADACVNGQCEYTPFVCNDGDPCTDDYCSYSISGACDYYPYCDDYDPCTIDACDGMGNCFYTPLVCDDGDACTLDNCNTASGCIFTPACCITDGDCNDNDLCTIDNCANGLCIFAAICNDNDPCTYDICFGGNCYNSPLQCDDNNPYTVDFCLNGNCVHRIPCIDNAPCDDQDACTTDFCDQDQFCTNLPADCNDNDACTTDYCDLIAGCTYTPVVCDDNDPCTIEFCDFGFCVITPIDCDDFNACTIEFCDNGNCIYVLVNCDDFDACTNDFCNPSFGCYTATVDCNDNNACTTDACNNGTCTHTSVNTGATEICNGIDDDCNGLVDENVSCDDGNACTADACSNGVCVFTLIQCNGNVVEVNQNVTVNFNTSPPSYTGDPDLLPYFTYNNSGPAANTWKAIFNLGSNKLLVKNGATITVTNVPNGTSNQFAPGIVINSKCEVEVENGGHIVVNSLNKNAGDIFIQAGGNILINGEIRNQVSGTNGLPGAITVISAGGDLAVGSSGLVQILGVDYGGNLITLNACGNDGDGEIMISGLVKSFAAAHAGDLTLNRPNIKVVALNGSVTVNANTAEPLYDEFQSGGGLYDIWGGLLSWVSANVNPGKVEVQAKGDITVNGHGTDPTTPVRESFGAIAAIATASNAPGGLVEVISLEGKIVGNDRAFDVSGRNRLTTNFANIRLSSKLDISLNRLGAGNNFNPVVDASSPGIGDKGGKNTLRSFSGMIIVGTNALVSASVPAGSGTVQGINLLSSCLGVTNGGTVTPVDLNAGDDNGTCSPAPEALFTECPVICDFPYAKMDKGGLNASGNNDINLTVYPNPFNDQLTFEFSVPDDSQILLEMFSITGEKIATVFEGKVVGGQINKQVFYAGELASGLYMYRMKTRDSVVTERVMLAR